MNMMTLSSTLRWVMCCLSSSLTHSQFSYQYITITSTSAHTFHDELVQVTVDIQAFLRIPGMPTFYEFLLKNKVLIIRFLTAMNEMTHHDD